MSNKKWLNAEPFSYRGRHGTRFQGTRCDLENGVVVDKPLDQVHHEDFVCFGSWHRGQIHKELSHFRGYDCVRFRHEASEIESPVLEKSVLEKEESDSVVDVIVYGMRQHNG